MSGMGLRDFINKQQGGSRNRHFRRWKDEGDHSATVFIHPAGQILALWRHPFMRVEAREDKVTRVQHLHTLSMHGRSELEGPAYEVVADA